MAKRVGKGQSVKGGASGNPEWVSGPLAVLVVDSDAGFADGVCDALSARNYSPETVCDPYNALRKIQDGNFLVVLCAVSLPGMGGIELLERIKKHNGMIRVIMIAENAPVADMLSCLRLGAEECILKPVEDMEAICSAVDEAVDRINRWSAIIAKMKSSSIREARDG